MSDIFNDFAKIAIEQGLISEAKEDNKSNPRFDSVSDDDIRALYGIKPNGEEKHILDQAHPESVVVSPAYDKVNGLVENLFERQDIMAWIATKPNDGKHTNERYVKASQDLTMALLNTAFMLDKNNETELMKLADYCAEQLNKSSAAVFTIPLIYKLGLGLIALTTTGLVNNFGGMLDSGVLVNSEKAIEELNDLISDNEIPGKEEDIQDLIRDIEYVKSLNEELTAFNIDGSKEESQLKTDIDAGNQLLKKYISAVRQLNKRITYVLSMAEAHARQQASSSWMAKYLGDAGTAIEKIWGLLWSSDIKDALVILKTLRDSLSESVSSMSSLYASVKAKAESGDNQSLEELLKVKVDEELPLENEQSVNEQLETPLESEETSKELSL